MKAGFCWCNMCGYNAHVRAEDRNRLETDVPCPDCEKHGDASLLCVGDELEAHVIPDEPMLTWPERDAK